MQILYLIEEKKNHRSENMIYIALSSNHISIISFSYYQHLSFSSLMNSSSNHDEVLLEKMRTKTIIMKFLLFNMSNMKNFLSFSQSNVEFICSIDSMSEI